MSLQHKRSSIAHKRPVATSLNDGQLALNINATSPGVFFKNSSNVLTKVGPVHIGTSAPNSSPATGGSTGNSIGEHWLDTTGGTYVLKIWDGTAWRSESGTFVDASGDTMTGALILPSGTEAAPALGVGSSDNGLYLPATDELGVSTNGSERLRIASDGDVGIGTTSPDGTLHVHTATAGSVSANGNADNLIVENSGAGGISILTPNASAGGLFFGTPGDNIGAALRWNHDNDQFAIGPDKSGAHLRLNSGDGVEAMRIDSSGNVGIGTTSPSDVLHLSKSDATSVGLRLSNTEGVARIVADNDLVSISADQHRFTTEGGTERLRIDSSGRVLVGTSSALDTSSIVPKIQSADAGNQAGFGAFRYSNDAPGPIVHLFKSRGTSVGTNTVVQLGDNIGEIRFAGADGTNEILGAQITALVDGTPGTDDMPGRLVFSTTADGASSSTEHMRIDSGGQVFFGATSISAPSYFFSPDSGGGTFVKNTNSTNSRTAFIFRINGTEVGTIKTSSSSTAYNTSSDYRLKENVVDLDGAITRVKQLQPRRFNFINDADTTVDGFIAHEAQAVVPEAVTGTKDEVDDDGNAVMQGIDKSKLVPLLTAALQEAIAKIETLEAKVAALEAG